MSIDNKKPLYRKVNKITHNGFRFYCQESDRYRFEKHEKKYANKEKWRTATTIINTDYFEYECSMYGLKNSGFEKAQKALKEIDEVKK